MAPRLRELSRIQKLYFALALIVCGLVFYAVGIATDFFASPIFSPFFIISNQTAHNVATYVAISIAVALTILSITLSLIKKRKEPFLEANNEPTIPTIKPLKIASVRTTQQTNDEKINNIPKTYGKQQENQSAKQLIMQPTNQSTTQASIQPDTDENEPINQQSGAKQNIDKIICPACKKEFSTPLLMVDYSEAKPKLVRHCPYCDQPLEEDQKKVAETEFWNKYLKQP
jgi:uncharacterized CHY-type Zn-finger protein